MTRYTLTILEEHLRALEAAVFHDEREAAALAICGRSQVIDPWTGVLEERFLVREIIKIPEADYIERKVECFTWSTTPFFNALKRAEEKDFAIAVIHSHPAGKLQFSRADDTADRELFAIAFNRLSSNRPHLSIIMNRDGDMFARAHDEELKSHPVALIRCIGKRWRLDSATTDRPHGIELDRQVRTFGSQSTKVLSQMRIGIVGCGGMGSAVASLLARIGVQRLALFDFDHVEETNLNRLHFSTRFDANLHRLKVDVIGEAIAAIGLQISVVRLPNHVGDRRAQDALRACDVVFGCTDDHLGRNLLNRLAHFYLIPVIDLGLLIETSEKSGYDVFDGRVTVIQPGYPCQVCRSLISPDRMRAESLQRNDPLQYEQQRRAGYVPEMPDPSPVVVTFSTEVAAMAVNELFQRLNGFRGDTECSERVRRFDEVKEADVLAQGKSKSGCRLCDQKKYTGRGDMNPFLDMAA
jgi:molybdopterin/thiamine biosynthesis adenylyltransferase